MTDDDVLAAMERYGGSFIHALAQCYRRADPVNRDTLKNAFAEYWLQYADLADRRHQRTICKTCNGTGMVAYWDGSALAGEMCPDCETA